MVVKIISILALVLLPAFAMASIPAEELANILAIKMNEAALSKDLSLVANTRGMQNDRSDELKKFMKDHQFDTGSLPMIHFSSHDSILVLHQSDLILKMDLSHISQGLIEMDGRTVKVSAHVEETYQAMLRTFSGTAKHFWLQKMLPEARAGMFDDVKKKLLSPAIAASEAVEFNDSLTAKNLMSALLQPLESKSIPEDFTCYGPNKVYYSVLAAPEKKGSDFQVRRRSFVLETTSSGGSRKLSVNGMGCEQIPMTWTADGWVKDAKSAMKPTLPAEILAKMEPACLFESQKQKLFAKCCATKGCEQDLQKQIAAEKKAALSKYKNVPAELNATQ